VSEGGRGAMLGAMTKTGSESKSGGLTYEQAGVSIEAGDKFAGSIQQHMRRIKPFNRPHE